MSFELFDTQALVALVSIVGLVAILGIGLVVGVAAEAVVRHRSTRVARHQSLRSYYAGLFHLHGPRTAS